MSLFLLFSSLFAKICQLLSKQFLFSKTSSRSLQDVFSVTLFVFQDLFKTSSRRLQDVFAIRLPKTSSRRLQDIFKTCLQDVLQLYLQDVFKTSWKTNKCYTEDVLKTSSRCLQYVFTKTNVCWVNAKVSIVEKRMY